MAQVGWLQMTARYIIVFRSKSQRLHLRRDGRAVSRDGYAKKFTSAVEARKVLRDLLARFPILRDYHSRVEALAQINARKNPRKRKTKKNPSRRPGFRSAVEAYARELDDADSRLSGFAGPGPRKNFRVSVKPIKAGFAIGKLEGVMYSATRDGESARYFHRFSKNSRPLLISDFDGSQLGIVGGQYHFTDRGIEDK